MTTTEDIHPETVFSKKQLESDRTVENAPHELFETGRTSLSRVIGFFTVISLFVTGSITFAFLIGYTSIEVNQTNVLIAACINGFLIAVLIFLIGKEIAKIVRSRRKGRAASRLHVRIIGLFCLVAAFPAILVAIVAGITLDLGLDRWFEIRTKRIVESSVSVARAYQNESTRVLMGNTLSMAANLDRNRSLYVLDRERFSQLLTLEARGRGLLAASLVREDGSILLDSDIETDIQIPEIPAIALELAANGEPVPIPPGNTNFVGAVFKMQAIPNAYLYTITAIPQAVIEALRDTALNSAEYNAMEDNRFSFQVAFAILYLGVCLVVLLCAIWMGISVATRIVTPIRRLMMAANEVSQGNLDVRVDVQKAEGDLHFLSETFNVMLTDLKTQQSDLLDAKELMDERARFIEAVLSGVSAAVIGLDEKGNIKIANKFALPILELEEGSKLAGGAALEDRVPELNAVFKSAIASGKNQYHEQITLIRDGSERTLNVQVTLEEEKTPTHSFVMTLDDITDLVSAQRNTAWADVARRIAHEIKNPLTPIQLSAERIKRRYGKHITEDREVFDKCTDTIIRQVGDIGKMVDEFSAFARMPVPEFTEGNLKNIVRETVFLQKVGFPEIEFDLDMEKVPLIASFDQRMLSQALINVIKNAGEAIEAYAGDEEDYKGKISVKIYTDSGSAIIDIIDNGKGLPESNRQRLLEPYMTTREKGTGLGLAIVRKIAEDHGGSIELMDAPQVAEGGHGAMMRFRLPILKSDEDASQTQEYELEKL